MIRVLAYTVMGDLCIEAERVNKLGKNGHLPDGSFKAYLALPESFEEPLELWHVAWALKQVSEDLGSQL